MAHILAFTHSSRSSKTACTDCPTSPATPAGRLMGGFNAKLTPFKFWFHLTGPFGYSGKLLDSHIQAPGRDLYPWKFEMECVRWAICAYCWRIWVDPNIQIRGSPLSRLFLLPPLGTPWLSPWGQLIAGRGCLSFCFRNQWLMQPGKNCPQLSPKSMDESALCPLINWLFPDRTPCLGTGSLPRSWGSEGGQRQPNI